MILEESDSGEARTSEVVITGMAGNFPGSANIDEFRDNLFNKTDMVNEKDCKWKSNNTWNVPSSTGNVEGTLKFDHAHFGIHHKQVLSLDPMTRLMMERSFEAVCDAGMSLADLKGTNTGVYMASTAGEGEMMFDYEVNRDGFGVLGQNRSMLSTRVSYYLDVNGPSFVAESSWCGGIAMLTQAFRDIQEGRCDAALVGAPSLTLFPAMSWHMMQLGMLSADAKCKAFDQAADGYGRSEAVVVLFLQRSENAKRIYASIVHSTTRCYGGRTSFVSPSFLNISTMLRNFYEECQVDPTTLSYLEADGAGIKQNDENELNAVDKEMVRDRTTPLLIGSVKSNAGHAEGASSLLSVVKVLLAMDAGYIPPNLHFTSPALGIPALCEGRLQVVTEKTVWPGGLAAVNAFGLDGNCSHILLKSVPRKKNIAFEGVPRLITVSGRTDTGLGKILTKIGAMPFNTEYIKLLQDVYEKNISHHLYRGFTLVEPGKTQVVKTERVSGQKRPIWFVFSGMGSQWPGMGKHLMRLPIFKAAIDKCHAVLRPKDLDLIQILTDPDPDIFDNIVHCFVGIAAVQIGLLDVLTALGIVADGIIGHSVGELGCAYADGCVTAEEMILAAYARGRASVESKLIRGTMAAIGLGYSQMKDMLPPGIEVACHNGPGSCTISGPAQDIEEFVLVLQEKGVFARSVNVANIAYHSRYIAPAAPRLLELLKEIIPTPKPRSSRWISTSIPEARWGEELAQCSSPNYHTNNLLNSVLFEEGCVHIPKDAITIEVAPHGLLQAILRRSLGAACTNVALAQRGHDDGLQLLLSAIGKLYLLGLQPTVSALYPPVQFPVATGTPALSLDVDWEHSEDWPLLSLMKTKLIAGEREVVLSMTQEEVRAYAGHAVLGQVVFPPIGYLKLVWETLASITQTNFDNLDVVFENVRFYETAYIPEKGSLTFYLMVQRGTGLFEVQNKTDKKLLATGKVSVPEQTSKAFLAPPELDLKGAMHLTQDDVYTEFGHRGYTYSGHFRSILSAIVNESGSSCKIQWQKNWVAFITSMLQQSLLHLGEASQVVQTPASIQRIVISPARQLQAGDGPIEVISHVTTSGIYGGGIQIHGLKIKPLAIPSNSAQENLRLQTLQFIPYKNPRLQSAKDFVDVCIQIAVENSQQLIRSKSNVTVIEKVDAHSLTPQIKECLLKYPHIEMTVKTPTTLGQPLTKDTCGSFLVVTTPSYLNQSLTCLEASGGFILTRVDNNDLWRCTDEYDVVAEQEFGRGKFLLLRKHVHLDASSINAITVTRDNSWIGSLRARIKEKALSVILVCVGEPQVGIASFIEHVSKEKGNQIVRFMFVLDKSAPKFSLSDNWYQEQLEQNLVMNIYQDGAWGSIRQLSVGDNILVSSDTRKFPLPSLTLDGVQLNYVGLNKKDFGENDNQCELGHVDFTGRSESKRWIMGVAQAGHTTPDPLLTWQVPEAWGMDEAATVPLAYATAYYALLLTCKLQRCQSVLIHDGCSSIGQAAIRIALHMSCRVYTTVANKSQHEALMSRFPQLLVENIFSSGNSNFEIQLGVATNSEGVDVVINNLPGNRLEASFRCVKFHGKFVQLGKSDLDKNSSIGMIGFSGSRSFYGVATDNLFNACQEWKERLHALVTEGIASGAVQPLDHRVFLLQQFDKAIGMLSDSARWEKVLLNVREANIPSNHLQADIIPRIQCDPKSSYLIVGGTTEEWLDLSIWLLERGVKKLLIAQQVSPITTYIARRVELLRRYHRATITLVPQDRASSVHGANNLVAEASRSGPLAGIFTLTLTAGGRDAETNGTWLSNSSSLVTIRNLDQASRRYKLDHFVCLACDGADTVCLARRQAGLAGLALQRDARQHQTSTSLKPALGMLDRLLGSDVEHAVIIFGPDWSRQKLNENKSSDASDPLNSFLPSSITDLVHLGRSLESTNSMEEVASLSPGLLEVKEVPPVFILPGLQGASLDSLHPLASRLMYPAFCVKLPRGGHSIEEMANMVAKTLRVVQPSGPYNLVGDSWAGALALALANVLEAQGERTQVFILEGAPETVKAILARLGEGHTLATNLICRLLNITSKQVKAELQDLPTWSQQLHRALSTLADISEHDLRYVEVAIETIRSHIEALLQFQPDGIQLSSLVTLIRPTGEEEHSCGLIKLCKNTVSVHLVGKDRREMLSSIKTTDIIGDNVIL